LTAASFAVCEARTYVVNDGDSLASIAQTTNTAPTEIARLNQLEGGAALQPGTVLALDDAGLADIESSLIPTEGADLAMWGAGPASSTPAAKGPKAGLRRLADRFVSRTTAIAANLTRSAMRFIGVPYVFGGTSTSGFDCSGYVQHVFAMLGLHLPRTADAQYAAGAKVAQIEPGDLVFFQTYTAGPSHVGIYLGNGNFVHASSSHGVMVSALRDSYWSARYLGAKRVVPAK
jgi:cell wall-associated NlpC family hydrolase